MSENVNEMTPERSLEIISETIQSNRERMSKEGSWAMTYWGGLVTITSLGVFILWKMTGSPVWNLLWFAMTIIGFCVPLFIPRKNTPPKNFIGSVLGSIWKLFGLFATVIAIITLILVPMNLTLVIIIPFGFAIALSGAVLRQWPIILAGIITGLGGAVMAVLLNDASQMLLFTFAGVILLITGLIVKKK